MLKNNVVRKRVLAIINEKITERQKFYDDKVHVIDNECAVDIKVKKASITEFVKTRKEKMTNDKIELLDGVVKDIIGKIID